jgi:hypothetical protein
MKTGRWKLGVGILIFIGSFAGWGTAASPDGQKQMPQPKPGHGKVFLYTAKKFGVPILNASIKIENGSSQQGKSLYQVHASVDSLHQLGFLFRMNNRFTSIVDGETCSPIRYVKEIDQEGLLIKNKSYFQTLTFDYPNKKIVVEKMETKERKEISLSSETYDPLSMFARCYLKEDLHPGLDIHMSIYDGVKLRQMIFYAKKTKVKSKIYGEVEAVCLESSTSFSSFEDKEGKIRIWYTNNDEKTPILIELELPIGDIKFELESMERN